MPKLITCVLPFAISLFAITFLSCDDYNIVEPRFFDEDSLVVFAVCDGDPYAEPEEVANRLSNMSTKLVVPDRYEVDACWFNPTEGILAVIIGMPVAGSYTVSLLNSGGGVEKVIHEGEDEAGYMVFPCTVDEDGVHALSLRTKHGSVVVWFEVK